MNFKLFDLYEESLCTQDTHISRLAPLRNMSRKTGGQGFEPQLPDPESGVLPIKLSPINCIHLVFYHIHCSYAKRSHGHFISPLQLPFGTSTSLSGY